MKTIFAIVAALCVAGLAMEGALAQQAPLSTANALAPVPALIYQSPLAGFVPLKEPAASPASTWREVNRAVSSYDSMAATMDDMPGMAMPAGHEMTSMPMNHDKTSMPMKPATKSTTKPVPKSHDMTSMPMHQDMPMDMNMDGMPGMKKGMK